MHLNQEWTDFKNKNWDKSLDFKHADANLYVHLY